MRRGTVAAVGLGISLIAVAAWCVWVIASASALRTAVADNVGALEEVRAVRARAAAIGDDPVAAAALSERGPRVAALILHRAPTAAAVAQALDRALQRYAHAPHDPDALRALDVAADAAVAAVRAENRRISIALGERWRDLNYVAAVVLVLAGGLLAAAIVSQRQRRRAAASEAALRRRTQALQDAAQHWVAGELAALPARAGPDDAFADVLERLRQALARHVAELERRNREVAELAEDLRAQLIQKSAQLARLSAAPDPLAPRLIAAQYQLGAVLGAGGMGAVYRATRVADGRVLAIKLMKDAGDETQRARFLREARLLAEVRHPNVLRILDVGVDDGEPYLVTELIEGQNLAAQTGPWPPPRALPVLRAIASGLIAVHAHGIVHRDLKLSNIMVGRTAGGEPTTKIVDFGIARDDSDEPATFAASVAEAAEAAEAAAAAAAADLDAMTATGTGAVSPATPTTVRGASDALTRHGEMIGTMRYIAPEARRAAPLTAAADIFAFGVLGVRLITGAFPWPSPAVVLAWRTGGLPPPTFAGVALPASLGATLAACLALEPAARPSAVELLAMLEPAA